MEKEQGNLASFFGQYATNLCRFTVLRTFTACDARWTTELKSLYLDLDQERGGGGGLSYKVKMLPSCVQISARIWFSVIKTIQ